LEEISGVKVNKRYQKSNWGKRPLPEDMLRYAQMDTHYLFTIRDQLAIELKQAKLLAIAEEDFNRACQVYRHQQENHQTSCWKIRGAKQLSPQKAAVLKKLCQYRDETARKQDQPVFKILSSAALLELAEKSPTTKEGLSRLDIPGQKAIQRHAAGLIKAIQAGLNAQPEYPPRKERWDDSYLIREKVLRDWRKKTARNMNVNSAVVLPRDLLYDLIQQNPTTDAELAEILSEVPWRLNKYGSSILSELQKLNS
jgi:ribonuclease D